MYQRKTRDVWTVQQNFGYGDGWEDVSAGTYREAKEDLRAYRENQPEYPVRLRCKRERIETNERATA